MKVTEIQPTVQERRAFGELADDIAYLRRTAGLIVAPYKGDFRIGSSADLEVVNAVGLRARARRERERRHPTRQATAVPMPAVRAPAPPPAPAPLPAPVPAVVLKGVETPPTKTAEPEEACKCGLPSTHYGRCWARRGMAGPPENSPGRLRNLNERLTALEAAVAELKAQFEAGR